MGAMSRPRATLAQEVAHVLRENIRLGRYACGERLVELAIAQSLQVSQNTVRDALRQLETEGWVRYSPRRGVRVRDFTAGEAEEVFALMAAVEGLALKWAFEAHGRAQLRTSLQPHVEALNAACVSGELVMGRDALFAFHRTLAALSDRPHTQSALEVLHNHAYLLTTGYDTRGPGPALTSDQVGGYVHLLGMLKFAPPGEAETALRRRILADGRPIVRWLALMS